MHGASAQCWHSRGSRAMRGAPSTVTSCTAVRVRGVARSVPFSCAQATPQAWQPVHSATSTTRPSAAPHPPPPAAAAPPGWGGARNRLRRVGVTRWLLDIDGKCAPGAGGVVEADQPKANAVLPPPPLREGAGGGRGRATPRLHPCSHPSPQPPPSRGGEFSFTRSGPIAAGASSTRPAARHHAAGFNACAASGPALSAPGRRGGTASVVASDGDQANCGLGHPPRDRGAGGHAGVGRGDCRAVVPFHGRLSLRCGRPVHQRYDRCCEERSCGGGRGGAAADRKRAGSRPEDGRVLRAATCLAYDPRNAA